MIKEIKTVEHKVVILYNKEHNKYISNIYWKILFVLISKESWNC